MIDVGREWTFKKKKYSLKLYVETIAIALENSCRKYADIK